MKSRLEEVEELLGINETTIKDDYGDDNRLLKLIDEKVALEIEKHDLLNKSQ